MWWSEISDPTIEFGSSTIKIVLERVWRNDEIFLDTTGPCGGAKESKVQNDKKQQQQ